MILLLCTTIRAQQIKSIVYDFEGFDLNATSLPEGDYSYGDLSYKIASNPLTASDIIGDRVLKMSINWNNGYAAFGRGISRYVELDATSDKFNFYFYNPLSNNQSATVEISIADDDNQSNAFETASDDSWKKTLTMAGSGGWQLHSIPLSDFTDGNTGGNGIFDIAFTQNKGMLLLVEFRFSKGSATLPAADFYIDMISFTEGSFPTGTTALDLPAKNTLDYCLLGAHKKELPGEYYKIPEHFEGMFTAPPSRKIKYAHTFLQWGTDGTATAKSLPGVGIQTLINDGYTPILTWEPQFKGFAPLDAVQPRLSNIINGDYNTYIDDFADKMKTYTDTVIIRLMHEFDGDWYPWCISQNGNDPAKFGLAFKTIVQRFKNKGVTKVKWMWCPNNDYTPYSYYNYVVAAYPGNNFVDIVATDIYNAHYPANIPWWRSFRWQTAEVYYYLTKNFPSKQFFICELASRERFSTEDASSETKAQWIAAMDKDLQSFFHKVRAIVFFDENKDQTWHVNSSSLALTSLTDNIWKDDYYFNIPAVQPTGALRLTTQGLKIYPNPSAGKISIDQLTGETHQTICIGGISGQILRRYTLDASLNHEEFDLQLLPGLYIMTIQAGSVTEVVKLIIQ